MSATGELRGRFIATLGNDLRNPPHVACASRDTLEHKLTDPALFERSAPDTK
jgi:hypothetical protein